MPGRLPKQFGVRGVGDRWRCTQRTTERLPLRM